MTNKDFENKSKVLKALLSTLQFYGKEKSFNDALASLNKLHRYDRQIKSLSIKICNGIASADLRQKKEDEVFQFIKDSIGCNSVIDWDPRGYNLRLYFTDEFGNVVSNYLENQTICNW